MTDEKDNDKPSHITLTNAREDNLGRAATRLLFKQYNPKGKLDINDWREIFVDTLDPTEYAGAIALLGSWKEWERFKNNWSSFQRLHLDEWLEEIEIRTKSLAIRSLVVEAQGGKNAMSAAKFLAEGKYKEKKAGRPSKGDVQRQTRIEARVERQVQEDFERLGIIK